jgi:hypothetical protein
MNRAVRYAAIALGLALAGYVGYGVYKAGDGEILPPNRSTSIVLESGNAFGRRGSGKSWSLTYDRVVANSDQTILDLYGIRKGTVFRDGRPYLRIVATHATVNTLTRDFTAAGHVHVETIGEHPGRAFDTSFAQWSNATQVISMPHTIAIRSGGDPPLIVGSLNYNVKTGDIDVTDIAGPARMP